MNTPYTFRGELISTIPGTPDEIEVSRKMILALRDAIKICGLDMVTRLLEIEMRDW